MIAPALSKQGFALLIEQEGDPTFEPFWEPDTKYVFEELVPLSKRTAVPESSRSDPYKRLQNPGAILESNSRASLESKAIEIEALTAMLAERNAMLVEMESSHQTNVAQIIAEQHATLAQTIIERFAVMRETLSEQLGNEVAEILRPFLNKSLREKAVEDLKQCINSMMENDAVLNINGQSEQIDHLKNHLNGNQKNIIFRHENKFEICVEMENAIISTRFGHWSKILSEDVEK